MSRAVLLALISVLCVAASGCGGSPASGGDDPAGAVPANAAFYAEATVRPEGDLRDDALAAAGKILRTDDPQAEIDELVAKAFATSSSIFACGSEVRSTLPAASSASSRGSPSGRTVAST